MDSLFEILYDVLFEPRTAMQKIAQQKNVGQALIVVLVSTVIPIWALSLGITSAVMLTMVHIMMGIKVGASIVIWIIGSAIWQLIAELLGGKGTAVGMLAALGFGHLPRILLVPLWMLISVMPPSSKTLLLAVAVLVILGWSLYLDVVAIKEVHQLSAAKAVLVILMPMLFIGLLAVIAMILIGSSAMMHMPMQL